MELKQYLLEQIEDADKKIINQISKDTNIESKLIKAAYEKYKNEFDAVPGSWKTDEETDKKVQESSPESMLQGHVLIFMDDHDIEFFYDAKEEKWNTEI